MAGSTLNLQILDQATAKELDLASELFHRINRVIPPNQTLLIISPNCRVCDAMSKMLKHGYSQVPVVENNVVLGVFSFYSFAKEAARMTLKECNEQRRAPGELLVEEFLEQFEFARVDDEMSRFFDAMDRDNGILIGEPNNLIGILTPMDFLRYLYQVASPFVMVSEIELALRALMRFALTEEQIKAAAMKCLLSLYGKKEDVPTTLEEMTFDNYKNIITNSDLWSEFEPVFRGNPKLVSRRLREIGDIRNDVFHFKREIRMQEHQRLAKHRNWLLDKVKRAEATRRVAEAQP